MPTGAGTIVAQDTYTVEVCTDWFVSWSAVSYLYPRRVTDCCAPSIPEGIFEYDYGQIKKANASAFAQISPVDLTGKWVRVKQSGTPIWYGRFGTEELLPQGGRSPSTRTGMQSFTAYGIGHELDRAPIDFAVARDGSGASITTDYCPPLNKRAEAEAGQGALGRKSRKRGNRSNSVNGDGVYEFSDDGDVWSNLNFAYNLLFYYPLTGGPSYLMAGQYSMLDSFHDSMELDGRSAWDVLNQLIDRRKGRGFFLSVDGSGNVLINVFSCLDASITLSGTTIPAATSTATLDLDTTIDISARVLKSTDVTYDKVLVRGNRMLTTFTMAQLDGTAVNDWDSGLATAYNSAGSGKTGYSSLTTGEKEDLNDRIRKDPIFAGVYARQRLPRNWDGKAGDGIGGTLTQVVPVCDEAGTITYPPTPPFTPLDKRFEHALPFEEGQDYSGAVPSASIEPTYVKPFAMVLDQEDSPTWQFCHDLTETLRDDFEISNAAMVIHPSGMAYSIKSSPNHVYADGAFGSAEPSATAPAFLMASTLATVSMYVDGMIQVSALRSGVSTPLNVKSLRIKDAEFWYVGAGTVLGTNGSGDLVRVAGDMVLRDDRERLWEACAMALAWYSQIRRALIVTQNGKISTLAPLGALITEAWAADTALDVNTVATSRTWDWGKNRSPTQTTLETQFIEWDWKE